METTDRVDASYTNSVQVLDMPKKKKKKKKKRKLEALERETGQPPEDAPLHSPLSSDPPPLVSWQIDSEENPVPRKKSKKKTADKEISDSQDDSSWIALEKELNSEVRVDLGHKKKKKRKRRSSEQDGVCEICVPENPEVTTHFPEATDVEVAEQGYESPPLKKKKKKKKKKAKELLAEEAERSEISSLMTNGKADSAGAQNPNQTDHSDAEGSMELFSSPLLLPETQHDPLFEEEESGAPGSDPPDVANSSVAPKKARKRKKNRSKPPRAKGSGANEDDLAAEENNARDALSPTLCEENHGLRKNTTSTHTDVEEPSSPQHPASETSSLFDDDFLESLSTPAINLESTTKELEEFVPHVRSLSASAVQQLASRDLDRFRRFKKQGIAVRFGKFTKKEDRLLKENIEAFLEETGIDSAEKLLFTHRFPEEKAAINKLKASHLFGVRIAEGIPRPWRLVYYRGRRLFDPQNHKGKYSEEEKQELKKYQAMYGNNWTKISELMCRSSKSVEQKFCDIRSDPKSGHWSEEETEKLIRVVAKVLRPKAKSAGSTQDPKNGNRTLLLDREMLYKGIPWVQIEAEMGTRNWKQCRKKWSSIVTKKLAGGQTARTQSESTRFRIKLIRRLNKLDVEEESEINWEDISSAMGNLPPNYLQSRYYKMKTSYVPFWNRKPFSEIIYYLYKKKLPQLKRRVKERAAVKTAVSAATKDNPGKDAFLFSYFFPDDGQDCPTDDEEETGKAGPDEQEFSHPS
uniref:Transcription termination factor 1 isoform X1 n=2 Tax=Pogona vitticeps TaxID=103695 RepID=A0ABM5F5K9_9SAUR